MARLAGISVRALRDIERGRVTNPRRAAVQGIAAALGVPVTDLPLTLPIAVSVPGDRVPALWIGVLGPLAVRRGDAPMSLASPTQRSLLGLLALRQNSVVGRDEIVDTLWGSQPPRTCHNLIHVHIGRLRRALGVDVPGTGPRIVASRGGYLLEVADDQLDLARFDRLVGAEDNGGTGPGTRVRLREALGRWRGPILAGESDRLRHHPAAVTAQRRRLAAALVYADLELAVFEYRDVIAVLRPLADEEPLHEALHARLMLALAGSGAQAVALALFAQLRERLADELGVMPGRELQEAHLRVLRQEAGSVQPPRPEVSVSELPEAGGMPVPRPAQLPSDVEAFTGRAGLLRQLDALVAERSGLPAIVVAGMAGVGKTALAVHWARSMRGQFPDGQLFVNLRGYDSELPRRPIEALAHCLEALGVPSAKVPTDPERAAAMYRSLLADRRVLIVLDDANHPDQIRPLLPGGDGCLVLVTSRDRLTGLVAGQGAGLVRVDLLSPAESADLLGRILGAERVAAEPEAIAGLAEVCGHLPLALRIAAADLVGRPERTIARHSAELAAGDRLAGLAVDGDRSAAVGAAFDGSYLRLATPARRLFGLLGLAPGADIGLPAAAALAGLDLAETEAILDRLVAGHLVDQPASDRYTLHDLLRAYALQRVTQEEPPRQRDAARRRLFDHYLSRTTAAARVLYPQMARLPATEPSAAFAAGPAAMSWLDAERPNLVAAIRYAASHGPYEVAWRLADAMRGHFWQRMAVVDWLVAVSAAAQAAEVAADPAGQASAHLGLAILYFGQGRAHEAIEHNQYAVEYAQRAGWLAGEGAATGNLSGAYLELGLLARATKHIAASLAIDRRIGSALGEAVSLSNLSLIYYRLGRVGECVEYTTEALTISERLGVRGAVSPPLCGRSDAYLVLGRVVDAAVDATDALVLARQTGRRVDEATALRCLAGARRDVGRYVEALTLAEQALVLVHKAGPHRLVVDVLNLIASVYVAQRRYALAAGQYAEAVALCGESDNVYEEAVSLVGLAGARLALGETGEARRCTELALRIAERSGMRAVVGGGLTVRAALALAEGRPADAAADAHWARQVLREVGYRLGEARALVLLGRARLGEDRATAAECWRAAVELFEEVGNPEAGAVRQMLNELGSRSD